MTPLIYKRTIDTRWRCVIRTISGRAVHRGTQCRNQESAQQYADLLQRDVARRAERGDLLPPPALTTRSRKNI